VARNPCRFFVVAVIVSVALSLIGLIVGEFAVEVESEGWWSRGTLQANRETQMILVKAKSVALFYYENQSNSPDVSITSVWDDLTQNNQAGFDALIGGYHNQSYYDDDDTEEEEEGEEEEEVSDVEDDIELRRTRKERLLSSSSSSSLIVQLLKDKQDQHQHQHQHQHQQ